MSQLATTEVPTPQIPRDNVGYLDEAYISNLSERSHFGSNYIPSSEDSEEIPEIGTPPPPTPNTLDDVASDATDEEWEELLEQTQQILVVFILPFIGRWLGRKFSFWGNY
ncbi:10348_t:CDS:1 [Cetraspora pellucida]|uniref:10348_t:CDS:1 n=1 Tax=Cetraspora pellucida TaxID=1433469 RepID=A0A9N8W770_9GLOM|nr:10348_t:CDS:1 [Cetraspora pellucida]